MEVCFRLPQGEFRVHSSRRLVSIRYVDACPYSCPRFKSNVVPCGVSWWTRVDPEAEETIGVPARLGLSPPAKVGRREIVSSSSVSGNPLWVIGR